MYKCFSLASKSVWYAQVDNQLHDAVFPTVLYPTPVPQHIVRRVGMKPCIEVAVMKRHRPAQNQDVYK